MNESLSLQLGPRPNGEAWEKQENKAGLFRASRLWFCMGISLNRVPVGVLFTKVYSFGGLRKDPKLENFLHVVL